MKIIPRPQFIGLFLLLAAASLLPASADVTAAREYLNQAKAAAAEIELVGDQSMILEQVASGLAEPDAMAALDLAARIRRPSDAARVLGATSLVLARSNPEGASQDIITAGRLLLRITNSEQRQMEQRLLLREIAPLQGAALPAGPELTPGEAQLEVVLGLAPKDPAAAYALIRKWQLLDAAADRALTVVANAAADTNPELALQAALAITSTRAREQALWRVALQRPPQEAESLLAFISDPLIKSAVAADAAVRIAPTNPEAADGLATFITVSPASVQAQTAIALTAVNRDQALTLARTLPDRPRRWALEGIAQQLAAVDPAQAELVLTEANATPEARSLVITALAKKDPARAASLALAMPAGLPREATLSAVAAAFLPGNVSLAKELLWQMGPSPWRAQAVQAIAVTLAPQDLDAATSLLGLVSDPSWMNEIRGALAVAVAGQNPGAAQALFQAMPPSSARAEAGVRAGIAALTAGSTSETALSLASPGTPRELALRWMTPSLARVRTRSPASLAGQLTNPYLRALAYLDIAHDLMGGTATVKPRPDLAGMIRPLVEWEQR